MAQAIEQRASHVGMVAPSLLTRLSAVAQFVHRIHPERYGTRARTEVTNDDWDCDSRSVLRVVNLKERDSGLAGLAVQNVRAKSHERKDASHPIFDSRITGGY